MPGRYFIEISFKGTAYHGWQRQDNAITVQSVLQDAVSKLIAGPVKVTGAGRTDTGVHALSFFAHFDCSSNNPLNTDKFIYSLNCILPADIAALNLRPVKNDAHARYSAVSRTYEYTVARSKDPFLIDFSWLYTLQLDICAMNDASSCLLKFTDFTSFSKLHSNAKTNICKISEAFWRISDNKLIFRITADRFLRNMVRSIVGTMIMAGRGRISIQSFEEIIQRKDRSLAGFSAPACGLSLINVTYPEDIYL